MSACPAPGALLVRLNQPGVGFRVATPQRERAAIAPPRLPWKTGGACCSSPWPLARAFLLPPSPPRRDERPTGTQGEQVQQPGAPSFPWSGSSCGARGEGRDVHARSEQARGGHRFWQHCSLLGFCPSVVGGTLMSTTLFPGDSSCAARSAICFCDTMR